MAPTGLGLEVEGAGLVVDGEGARERRWAAAEGGEGLEPSGEALMLGLRLERPEGVHLMSVAGLGTGCERMAGPAARTVSIAVEIAVCMGMLGRADTVAATMFAI